MAKSKQAAAIAPTIRFVIGIDPGTGSTSDCAVSIFNAKTREIVIAQKLPPLWGMKPAIRRIQSIVEQFQELIYPNYTSPDVLFCVESFVMRGKGGETLQRMIGAVLSAIPAHCPLIEIQNSTVKNHSAGHGHADKKSVATGILDYFQVNSHAYKCIQKLILDEEWDILDSLAIGAMGYEEKVRSIK